MVGRSRASRIWPRRTVPGPLVRKPERAAKSRCCRGGASTCAPTAPRPSFAPMRPSFASPSPQPTTTNRRLQMLRRRPRRHCTQRKFLYSSHAAGADAGAHEPVRRPPTTGPNCVASPRWPRLNLMPMKATVRSRLWTAGGGFEEVIDIEAAAPGQLGRRPRTRPASSAPTTPLRLGQIC